ncbi:hypothetical protein [Shouchella lonarensis]|uniref:Uncharacterized protein n=1 Tax=Shouchella lonarensis TaxID=1464122 RepID=A0A1G6GUE1_9BACI|nr:hypothetical protein [Shouchella lonarensis]SDB85650.1 hypothetical protein SAMN05421737_10236 [Shouchella lonarensis]
MKKNQLSFTDADFDLDIETSSHNMASDGELDTLTITKTVTKLKTKATCGCTSKATCTCNCTSICTSMCPFEGGNK